MSAEDIPGTTTTLSRNECWDHVRQAVVGRLAVIRRDGQPDIFPVNFVDDQGTVVFRSNRGTKRSAARDGTVAFEVDGADAATQEAWSVVIVGTVVEIKDTDEIIDAMGLHLLPWHDGPKPHYLRLIPHNVTGRRFRVRIGVSIP